MSMRRTPSMSSAIKILATSILVRWGLPQCSADGRWSEVRTKLRPLCQRQHDTLEKAGLPGERR